MATADFSNLPQSADQMTDIVEIAGVHGSPFLFWSKIIIAVVVVLLASVVLYFIFKKIRQSILNRKNKLTPEDKANLALQDLRKRRDVEQGRIHLYYFRLDEILRTFLDDSYGLSTLDQTFEELQKNARVLSDRISDKQFQDFSKFWQRAQFAKFAKASSESTQCEEDLKLVQKFINSAAKIKQATK